MKRLSTMMGGVSHANHHQNDNLSQADVDRVVELDAEIEEWESKDNNFERAERLIELRQQRARVLEGKIVVRKGDH